MRAGMLSREGACGDAVSAAKVGGGWTRVDAAAVCASRPRRTHRWPGRGGHSLHRLVDPLSRSSGTTEAAVSDAVQRRPTPFDAIWFALARGIIELDRELDRPDSPTNGGGEGTRGRWGCERGRAGGRADGRAEDQMHV